MFHNCVSIFQDKLDDSAYKILTDYQTATVTLLALISAATGDVSKCAFTHQILYLAYMSFLQSAHDSSSLSKTLNILFVMF